jgi:hypothetical protein
MRKVVTLGVCAVLSGCAARAQAPAPEPYRAPVVAESPRTDPPKTREEWCRWAADFLGNPYGQDWQKAAILEMMRNRKCLN